jgi:hypothetical protein
MLAQLTRRADGTFHRAPPIRCFALYFALQGLSIQLFTILAKNIAGTLVSGRFPHRDKLRFGR